MYKKGDKVVPTSKSVGESWDYWLNKTSKIVRFYLINGYLIYNGITHSINNRDVILLSDGETFGGDFFLEIDLKSYVPSKALSLFL